MPTADDRFTSDLRESVGSVAGAKRPVELARDCFESGRAIAEELSRGEVHLGGNALCRLPREIAAIDDLEEPRVVEREGLLYDLAQGLAGIRRRFRSAKRAPEKMLIEAVRRPDSP